jgi:ATP-binding cassette, subfamily C (CFTR/MRP), member 1
VCSLCFVAPGQKARISFARTVYRNADICLLDDPLSAVDAQVGESIFTHGVRGVLGGKTVVLVTHQVHLLDLCDHLIVVDEGRVKYQGSPAELKAQGVDLNALINSSNAAEATAVGEEEAQGATKIVSGESDQECVGEVSDQTQGEAPVAVVSTSSSKSGKKAEVGPAVSDAVVVKDKSTTKPVASSSVKDDGKKLLTTEERQDGVVPLHVYHWYLSKGGLWFIAVVILLSSAGNGASCYAYFWLADWGKQSVIDTIMRHPMTQQQNLEYFNKYAWLTSLNVVGALCRTWMMVTHGLIASRVLHVTLIKRILSTSVAFFDTTPTGRIINRFSSDVVQSDEGLAYNIGFVIGIYISLLGVVGNISYSTNGTFCILLVPLAVMYYRIQLFFRRTNTELKRLENISRSPIYTEFQQTLQGVSSVRAFQEERKFFSRLQKNVNENNTVNLVQQLATWWLGIRLDIIGGTVSFFVAALAAGNCVCAHVCWHLLCIYMCVYW